MNSGSCSTATMSVVFEGVGVPNKAANCRRGPMRKRLVSSSTGRRGLKVNPGSCSTATMYVVFEGGGVDNRHGGRILNGWRVGERVCNQHGGRISNWCDLLVGYRIRNWCGLLVGVQNRCGLLIGGPKFIIRGNRGRRCDSLNP